MSDKIFKVKSFSITRDIGSPTTGLNFTLAPSQLAHIIGLAGSGKSTLAESMYHPVDNVEHAGLCIRPTKRVWVPQNAYLTLNPTRSAYKHVQDICPTLPKNRIIFYLNSYGFPTSCLLKPTMKLSIGQAQILAIAISLLHPTDLVIADDIFSGLDTEKKAVLKQKIAVLQKQGTSFVIFSPKQEFFAHDYFFDLSAKQPESIPIPVKKTNTGTHPILSLESITLTQGKTNLLFRANLMLYHHEHIGIVGPNGFGKSSLIQAIMQNITYDGQVKLSQEIISSPKHLHSKQMISLMHQQTLSLFNPEFPLRLILEESFDKTYFFAILEAFNIRNWQDQHLHQVSFANLKTLAFARALARKRHITILDEPFASMDTQWITSALNVLSKHIGATIIIDHHFELLSSYCDRVYSLNKQKLHEL